MNALIRNEVRLNLPIFVEFEFWIMPRKNLSYERHQNEKKKITQLKKEFVCSKYQKNLCFSIKLSPNKRQPNILYLV